jgi:hypothetical protein
LIHDFGKLCCPPIKTILFYKKKFYSHFLHSSSQRSNPALNLPGSKLGALRIHYLLPSNFSA